MMGYRDGDGWISVEHHMPPTPRHKHHLPCDCFCFNKSGGVVWYGMVWYGMV